MGKLHHRAILDEDQREVRLFQEAFLEDGELHSDNARTRKFRWKDADEDIGDLERRPSDDDAEDPTGNTQVDEKWRLERLEREKWVKESELTKSSKIKIQGGSEDDINNDEDSDNEDSQFFSMATKALKKLHKKKSHSSTLINGVKSSSGGGDSLVAIANDIKEQDSATRKDFKSPKGKLPLQIVSNNSSNVRGSFLSRCSSTLEKLAEMTKSASEARTGSGAKNSRNFVFALLSPEKAKADSHDKESNDLSCQTKQNSKGKGKTKSHNISHAQDAKKFKIDRSIDENSSDTIFGLL